jgi:hypothetical protein
VNLTETTQEATVLDRCCMLLMDAVLTLDRLYPLKPGPETERLLALVDTIALAVKAGDKTAVTCLQVDAWKQLLEDEKATLGLTG